EVFAWLGLDAEPGVVDAALREAGARYNVDLSAPAVRAGKWRERFTAEDLATFDRVAGATLAELGYEPSSTEPQSAAPAATTGPTREDRGTRRLLGRLRRGKAPERADGFE